MSQKLDAMLLSGTGFSLCFCSLGEPVKRALVEHPDSYEWLFTKSITG